ncbi:hypothetical protein BESB_027640 [Besnoitia besnoiti]|uniref:Uncharacterized protein n=1 Tax=Besnoitia besnoiti TaxID=94643 RepID=A0A2A9M050_BESBE|nr:uncharacterized protein BESB_027640 [Besnoitia besnoiti]PFH31329.1 hypothetical protein BESB_027640 [Besnoitia besnoiti]
MPRFLVRPPWGKAALLENIRTGPWARTPRTCEAVPPLRFSASRDSQRLSQFFCGASAQYDVCSLLPSPPSAAAWTVRSFSSGCLRASSYRSRSFPVSFSFDCSSSDLSASISGHIYAHSFPSSSSPSAASLSSSTASLQYWWRSFPGVQISTPGDFPGKRSRVPVAAALPYGVSHAELTAVPLARSAQCAHMQAVKRTMGLKFCAEEFVSRRSELGDQTASVSSVIVPAPAMMRQASVRSDVKNAATVTGGEARGSIQKGGLGGPRGTEEGSMWCSDRKRKILNGTEYIRRKSSHRGRIKRGSQAPAYKR